LSATTKCDKRLDESASTRYRFRNTRTELFVQDFDSTQAFSTNISKRDLARKVGERSATSRKGGNANYIAEQKVKHDGTAAQHALGSEAISAVYDGTATEAHRVTL